VVKVGIGVLAADTGETVRALQHWCDLGVLVAEPATEKKGRGYHREFKSDERKWALLASALNKLRVPLTDIAKYLRVLRDYYRVENYGADDMRNALRRFNASPMSRALKSDFDVFLMLSLQTDTNGLEIKMKLFEPIHDVSVHSRTLKEQMRFSRENPQSYFLNLTQIWAPLREPA
jgi:DNA-binding transcriptional MerR regulator